MCILWIICSDSRLKDNSRELIDRQYGDFENEGVDVGIELVHNNNDNVLINDDNCSEIMTSNMIYLLLENRMSLLNVIEKMRITEIRPEDVNLRSML